MKTNATISENFPDIIFLETFMAKKNEECSSIRRFILITGFLKIKNAIVKSQACHKKYFILNTSHPVNKNKQVKTKPVMITVYLPNLL